MAKIIKLLFGIILIIMSFSLLAQDWCVTCPGANCLLCDMTIEGGFIDPEGGSSSGGGGQIKWWLETKECSESAEQFCCCESIILSTGEAFQWTCVVQTYRLTCVPGGLFECLNIYNDCETAGDPNGQDCEDCCALVGAMRC